MGKTVLIKQLLANKAKLCLLLVVLCCWLTDTALAQNTYYYYENEKVVLEPVTQKILVKFNPEIDFQEQKTILEEEFLKTINNPPEGNRKGYIILETKEGTTHGQIQSYLNRLLQNKKVLSASFFYKAGSGSNLAAQTDELMIQLKSSADLHLLDEEAAALSLTFESPKYFNPDLYLVKVSKASPSTAGDIANRLHETGKFAFAEPNLYVLIDMASNDPLYGQQWSLENTGTNTSPWNGIADADIDANDAWPFATGNGVTIAIIDDGVQLNHQDLGPFTRLLFGYDATETYSSGSFVSNSDAHGTNCAGIAAATKDNGNGVAGVAPNAYILPIRLLVNNTAQQSDIVRAFNYAICKEADVINNSWGIDRNFASNAANEAINRAVTVGRGGKGAVVLAATQNYNSSTDITWPATKPNVIAVGAASMCNQRKSPSSCDGENWGSNYGRELDVVAPGVWMPTTDLTGSAGYAAGDYNLLFNGTSSATPVASGIAALIISINRCFMGSEVREILEKTANKVGNYTYATTAGRLNGPWHEEMGYGMVNANDAVQEAISRGARTCPEPTACLYYPPNESRKAGSALTKPRVESSIVSYPNPFGQCITFSYNLPNKAIVSLVITDALGRKITVVQDKVEQKAGNHEVTYMNSNLPAGMYFYTFTVGKETRTYKLLKVE